LTQQSNCVDLGLIPDNELQLVTKAPVTRLKWIVVDWAGELARDGGNSPLLIYVGGRRRFWDIRRENPAVDAESARQGLPGAYTREYVPRFGERALL
jgi:hypothetical protein